MSKRIEDIDRQLEQLKARRAALLAQDETRERRRRTRMAIILGTWLMSNRPDLVDHVKGQLVRPQDRRAFGIGDVDMHVECASASGQS
ncbi:MAG: hypothetical protein EON93_26115 [Burkholderiales bacterium]|nr:MAG: hypothetical protein EON93_26115 [Burkholderiales bacterium]